MTSSGVAAAARLFWAAFFPVAFLRAAFLRDTFFEGTFFDDVFFRGTAGSGTDIDSRLALGSVKGTHGNDNTQEDGHDGLHQHHE